MLGYDLESLKLPKLSGLSLRLFAAVLDRKITRSLLLPSLLSQGGISEFRTLEAGEEPTMFPLAVAEEPAAAPLTLEQVDAAIGAAARPGPFATTRDYAIAYRTGSATPPRVGTRYLGTGPATDCFPGARLRAAEGGMERRRPQVFFPILG